MEKGFAADDFVTPIEIRLNLWPDKIRNYVGVWLRVRPALWQVIFSVVSRPMVGVVLSLSVPTGITDSQGAQLYYHRRYQLNHDYLERVGEENLPKFLNHVMQKEIMELLLATGQPKLDDLLRIED